MTTDFNNSIGKVHPEYDALAPEWNFYKGTYDGGRAWFPANMDKYFKEGTDEYNERVERAYRFNHTREVVDLVNKYIFKADIARKDDAEDYIKKFWTNATLQKRDIEHFMTQASTQASIFGRVWIVVDNNLTDKVVSVAAKKSKNARTYAYTVSPLDVMDLSWSDDGELNWIKIKESTRDDSNPLAYTGSVTEKVRLWTRDDWFLFNATNNVGGSVSYELEDSGTHGLGIVPVTYLDHNETDAPFTSTALIADIAYLDRKAANYLSNLDAIIQDQSFSQLVIPSDAVTYSEEGEGDGMREKMLEFGTKRIFLYHASESGGAPSYISPDPAQPEMILSVVNKIIGEIYHSVGMAGERTKQDNAVGIDNSSGVAKAYDFERMNAMLANKAKALEFCENRILRIVKAWENKVEDFDVIEHYVTYSRDFDVRNLSNEFDIANNLAIIDAPKTLRQEQMNTLVDKLYPQMAKSLRDAIAKDVKDEWLKEPTAQELAAQGLTKPALPKQSGKQGQNNKPAKKSV